MEKFNIVLVTASVLKLVFLLALLQLHIVNIEAQPGVYDYSYMKSVKNATDTPLVAQYDYIVIGGGTAGCPLAATLSSNYSVLVLERGGVPLDHPDVLRAAAYFTILNQPDDGSTPAQKFTSEDGVLNWRGRILGGTSMINGGFYSRAQPEFYNISGIDWDANVVQQSYEWVEETVAYRRDLYPWNSIAKAALLEANVTPDNGFTLDHLIGTKASASIFDASSPAQRFGAVELLNKANLSNLRVVVRATVERIIFFPDASSGLAAKGVLYTDSAGRVHQAFVRGKGEVILSAGHIGSPQLLLLSGIGPKSYLSSLKIPVIYDHPYVGKFVYDNPFNYVSITSPTPLNPSALQVVGIMENYTYIETSSRVNVGSFFSKVALLLSIGSYSLVSSTNVRVPPKVRYNYFSHPLDLARCVNGIQKIGEVLNTTTLDEFKFVNSSGGREFKFVDPAPPSDLSNVASVEAFCRNTVNSTSHYHGGCLVEKVVDSKLRVKGIGSLRIVDASVLNMAAGTNPQATIMMLGRYIGLQILKKRIA